MDEKSSTPTLAAMGFSEAVTKFLTDAEVDAALVWTAIKTKEQEAVAALQSIFGKLLGKAK